MSAAFEDMDEAGSPGRPPVDDQDAAESEHPDEEEEGLDDDDEEEGARNARRVREPHGLSWPSWAAPTWARAPFSIV
jgi:hypothetical protein